MAYALETRAEISKSRHVESKQDKSTKKNRWQNKNR